MPMKVFTSPLRGGPSQSVCLLKWTSDASVSIMQAIHVRFEGLPAVHALQPKVSNSHLHAVHWQHYEAGHIYLCNHNSNNHDLQCMAAMCRLACACLAVAEVDVETIRC